MTNRRQFIRGAALCGLAGCAGCCSTHFFGEANAEHYAVAVLGDTHFDTEPESVYHSHYDESNKHAQIHHAEFRRNGEMWRERCRTLLAASGGLAKDKKTDFVLQVGDLIQGDCDDVPTHQKMLKDCIDLFSSAYPKDLPFLTVMGNHDFRGKGARAAYLAFAEPHLSRATGVQAKYPVFSFRRNGDLWVFCDFGTTNIDAICACIEASPDVRHTFLVTHGPFTCPEAGGSPRWRLAGSHACDAGRARLYELLSRRHAVVLSGHTHTIAHYRHANQYGGFTEFTANSVWKAPGQATAVPRCDKVEQYGTLGLGKLNEKERLDHAADTALFRAGLKAFFLNSGAGHFRLDVGPAAITMEFYPGAATTPARTFDLYTAR